jgi:two-component Ni(II)/redox sensor kinase NrsS
MANAIQYTSPGGSVLVSLEARDSFAKPYGERMAIIAVKDTGIGIPAAEQSRIFERFYRVDSDRSRKTGGTGLGLAIAKAIAQHHRGHLTVQSDVGQGSVFSAHLPIIYPPVISLEA